MRTFFAPAHITGFFEVRESSEPLRAGSVGAGVVLERGVDTGVEVEDAEDTSVQVYFNGELCSLPTTETAVRLGLKGTCGAYKVKVHHFSKLPLAQGFGVSAACAISALLALNEKMELGMDYASVGKKAHLAEMENNTGRGDVIAEFSRGLVLRLREGAPGIGRIRSLQLKSYVVAYVVGGALHTSSVLGDKRRLALINAAGKLCLKALLKDLSPKRFLELSKSFAIETGLAGEEVLRAMKELEEKGVTAGMCMLGNTVFTITDEPEDVAELLPCRAIVSRALEKDIRSLGEARIERYKSP